MDSRFFCLLAQIHDSCMFLIPHCCLQRIFPTVFMAANLQNQVDGAAQPGVAGAEVAQSLKCFSETRLRCVSFDEMKNMFPEMSEKDLYRLFQDGSKQAVMMDIKEVQQVSKTESLLD